MKSRIRLLITPKLFLDFCFIFEFTIIIFSVFLNYSTLQCCINLENRPMIYTADSKFILWTSVKELVYVFFFTSGMVLKLEQDKLWGDTPCLLKFLKSNYLFDKFAIELVALQQKKVVNWVLLINADTFMSISSADILFLSNRYIPRRGNNTFFLVT